MVAGFIDSIAGGGGLVTVPALLAAGIPPLNTLATNKLQSMFGVATSCARFARTGLIDFRGYAGTALIVFLGACAGVWAVQSISNEALGRIVPFLLMGVVCYVLFSPRMTDADQHQRLGRAGYAPIAGLVGFYDGFFGPGAGSFYATSLVALRGKGLIKAAANSKLFNLMSNVASVALFAAGGHMLWLLGLVMAAGNMTGAWLGTHLAIRFGARLIRPFLIIISLALTAKLVWENFIR